MNKEKKWILPKTRYEENLDRQRNTFIQHRLLKNNEIALWNKNRMNYTYWKVCKSNPKYDAIILMRKYRPLYWKEIILPLKNI